MPWRPSRACATGSRRRPRRWVSPTTAGAGGSGSAPCDDFTGRLHAAGSRARAACRLHRLRHLRPKLPPLSPAPPSLRSARRRLILDGAGLSVSAIAFGLVYGLAARTGGFSLVEMLAMSAFVLAGAAQFAAIGLVAGGVPVAGHPAPDHPPQRAARPLLGGAGARGSPGRRRLERAAMAYVLTDETFGLTLPHFRRPRARRRAAATGSRPPSSCRPGSRANLVGYLGGQGIPDPTRLGIDVVFPAAMAGIAAALVTGRRELVAAVAGAAIAVGFGLVLGPSAGIVAGGLLAPLIALLVRHAPRPSVQELASEYAVAPLPLTSTRSGRRPRPTSPRPTSLDTDDGRWRDDRRARHPGAPDGRRDLSLARRPAAGARLRPPAAAGPRVPAPGRAGRAWRPWLRSPSSS